MRLQNTWAERQRQVLDCLAEANNCDDQKLGPLDNFNLVMGDQTVKKFESWRGWVNTFLDWLHAIQNRHKPCASFLIPHNDFGPDLVFALRKRNGSEDKIVLCSIQVSEAQYSFSPFGPWKTLSRALLHESSLTFSLPILVEIGWGFD